MQSKISLTWTLLIIGTVGIACFSLMLFFLHLDLPGQIARAQFIDQIPSNVIDTKSKESTLIFAAKQQVIPGLPIRLKISKIHVDALLENVGLTPKGEVGIPKGPTNAAWFNVSPRPGASGSSVITGHYGRWKNGIPTVFNNLDKLRKGDKISVEDQKGSVIIFVVRELRTFDSDANAVDVFGMNDGKSHLNLITCEGIWNKLTKSYPKRLVVFADKE